MHAAPPRVRAAVLCEPPLTDTFPHLQNPFGDAKPREAVIAQRTGKNETDVVAAEAQEYQVKVRLTPEQYAQKQERVQEINELKDTLAADPENAETVQVRHRPALMRAARLAHFKRPPAHTKAVPWPSTTHTCHRCSACRRSACALKWCLWPNLQNATIMGLFIHARGARDTTRVRAYRRTSSRRRTSCRRCSRASRSC